MIRRLPALLLPLALFLVVLGLKLDVLGRAGSDLPNWDQWDAEGLHLYLPWAEHRLGPADFLRPHNEHRIVLTKLLAFAEILVNGQWDARLQCVVNALLHCSVAVLFFVAVRRHLAPGWQFLCFLLLALFCGLPVAWQNVLGGFHSQQYFLLGLSGATLWLLPGAAPWSRRWWLGAACAFLALFSMGSGLFAAAVVLPAALLRGWLLRQRPLLPLPTLIACLLLVALGWLLRVEVDYHDNLKAHTAADFLLSTLRSLQWPLAGPALLALPVWAPFFLLAATLLRRRPGGSSDTLAFPLFILALGSWTLLQILATAYARGAGADYPASRYVDTLVAGVLANALALAWLTPRLAGWPRRLSLLGSAAWLALILGGLAAQTRPVYRDTLPDVRRHMDACEDRVRRYLATDDPRLLDDDHVPYPSARSFRERIDLTALRALMPASVRAPLTLETFHPGPFRLHDTRMRRLPGSAPAVATTPAGLPPDFTPLPAARTWGSAGASAPGEWIGVSFTLPRRTYLRFHIAGDADASAASVSLLDSASGRLLATLPPPAGTWQAVDVPAPRGPVTLRAQVSHPDRWLAFSEPVELAPLSHLISRLVPLGPTLWLIAAAASGLLWLLTALLAWRTRKALAGPGRPS
jgi:hypothetical protein